MKIAVLAHGSRGDVQPPLVLAHHLMARGHEVTLVVPANYASIAGRLGGRVVSLGLDPRAVLAEGGLRSSLRRGHTVRFFREAFELEKARFGAVFERVQEGCRGADLLVVPPLLEDLAVSIAEAHRQRVAFLLPMPLWSNSLYPSFFISTARMPGWLNRVTYTLTELGARPIAGLANGVRLRLGLERTSQRPSVRFRVAAPPVFYWVPPAVLPPPPEFGANHRFTGYWGVPPAVRAVLGESVPPAALVDFLTAGEAPLYVGLGSMPVVDEEVLDVFRETAERIDRRVVLGRGWSETPIERSARLHTVDDLDHDWLLPRCVAAVHHGGASTTGSVLQAGIPAVVASVFADQPFWGRRISELGTGETFPFQRLSVPRLERSLRRVLSEATRARARSFGETLRAEPDGAELTASVIHEHGMSFPVPARLG